jgi:AGCS family alanine or glycine:cation symporter
MQSFLQIATDFLTKINHLLWGIPALIVLFGAGIFLTWQLRFIQFRRFREGFRLAFCEHKSKEPGAISRFEALATSLSGAIGTGNIAGVAIAISMGGPGSIFWLWLSAIIGMATKYASCTLALQYREVTQDNSYLGGPMYTLKNGLKMPKLGAFFALCTVLACFGTGNTVQANSIASGMHTVFSGHPPSDLLIGCILSVSVGMVILGGVQRIAKVASVVVPFMAIMYFATGIIILALNYHRIPQMFFSIFNTALNPHAVGGAGMALALRYGLARGIFSNEAGLGSAPIAHAAARTKDPTQQGLVAMIDPLIDTILICTTTALVLLIAAPQDSTLKGAALSAAAFQNGLSVLGFTHAGAYIVGIGLIFFAYTTIIAWCYYGEQCLRYLLKTDRPAVLKTYRLLYTLAVIPGAVVPLHFIWQLADFSNILMAVPNIISVILLAKVVKKLTDEKRPTPTQASASTA